MHAVIQEGGGGGAEWPTRLSWILNNNKKGTLPPFWSGSARHYSSVFQG